MRKKLDYEYCSASPILEWLGDKWALVVLLKLHENGIIRFNELYKTIPSISPQGDTRKNEEILLVPPEYALNKQTHNYEGLIEELERQKVTSLKEKNAILRLTDFGRLGGKIWKIIYDINNSPQMKARIVMPGKYILKLLQN